MTGKRYQKIFRKFGTSTGKPRESWGNLGKTCGFRLKVPKVPKNPKKFGTAETQSYQGFEGCSYQKIKIFTIVAKESCTQIYITIEKKEKIWYN
jgi:hypothetical protein